jgi:hypothetical protein
VGGDVPKRVVVASAASRKASVSMPPSGPILTSENDVWWVSNHVFPGGIAVITMSSMLSVRRTLRGRYSDVSKVQHWRLQGC